MKDILTLREAGRILNVNPETLRLWIRDGLIQAVITPGTRPLYRIKRETLNALLSTSSQNEEGAQTMKKDEIGVPVPKEVEELLQREREQAGGITLADFTTQAVLLWVNKLVISCGNHGWQCSCLIFQEHQSCRHLMALGMLVPSFPSLNLQDLQEGFSKKDAD